MLQLMTWKNFEKHLEIHEKKLSDVYVGTMYLSTSFKKIVVLN